MIDVFHASIDGHCKPAVRPGIQAVLDLIDPVPDEVRIITDQGKDDYYRVTEGGNVWRGECGCCYFTYQDLLAVYGPITWEGRDA